MSNRQQRMLYPTWAGIVAVILLATACSDGSAETTNPTSPSSTPESTTSTTTTSIPAGSWTTLESNTEPTARHEASYVEAGGKFYLMGGRGMLPVDVYDPSTGNWSALPGPPIELHHFQAVELNGLIYVVGAWTGDFPTEREVPNIYLFDPARPADPWIVGDPNPADRLRGSGGTVVYEGRIYLVAGITGGHGAHATGRTWFDVYDPESGVWTSLPDVPLARDHFHAAVVGHSMYLAGGRDTSMSDFPDFWADTIGQIDVYDFNTGTWSTLHGSSNIPTERAGTSVGVLNDHLIVIGGEELDGPDGPGGDTLAWPVTEALNVATGKWLNLDDLNMGRHGTQAVICNGGIYIVAGSTTRGGAGETSSQELFSLAGASPCP